MAELSLPIHWAATRGDVAALRRELDNGVSPDTPDPTISFTPLHYLCAIGTHGGGSQAAVCINLLIERGVNVNAGNSANVTPLHFAILNHQELVPLLLDSGADPNHTMRDGESALHYAVRPRPSRESLAVVRQLIRAGADPKLRNHEDKTPMDLAVERSRHRLCPIFLRAGANPRTAQTTTVYLQKVITAGSFRAYERNHLNAITATFVPKFPRLPPELVRRVVEYAFHVGDY